MATLTGNQIQNTYESLIKIGDNTSGFGSLKQLSDSYVFCIWLPVTIEPAKLDFDKNIEGEV